MRFCWVPLIVLLTLSVATPTTQQTNGLSSDLTANRKIEKVSRWKTYLRGAEPDSANVVRRARGSALQHLIGNNRDKGCGSNPLPSNLTEMKAYDRFKFNHRGISLTLLSILFYWTNTTMHEINNNSTADAKARFGSTELHNGPGDAFRVALAMYRVTKEYNAMTAKAVGDAYERQYVNPLEERLMDLYNHRVGRCLAENPSNQDKTDVDVIMDAVETGKLQVAPDRSYAEKWPSFADLWSNYPRYHQYNSTTTPTLIQHCKLPKKYEGSNACAIRVSLALITSGHRIYFDPAKHDWAKCTNDDGERYILRVRVVRSYLEEKRGGATVTGETKSNFLNKKGIIVFEECSFSGATGHVDIWNGTTCGGQCYFMDWGHKYECKDNRLFEFD